MLHNMEVLWEGFYNFSVLLTPYFSLSSVPHINYPLFIRVICLNICPALVYIYLSILLNDLIITRIIAFLMLLLYEA
jgi:hypothetical protein